MSHVDYLETDAVATVRMRRPKRHNAMTAEMARDVADALQRAADDEAVRCIAVTGAESVYNTGADLTTFEGDESDAERLKAIATPLHEAVLTMVTAPKPVVTGINGVVAGGGLGLALAGDVAIMAEDARIEYAYPKIGLSGDGGVTWLLPRLVGLRRAQEITLLDEPVSATDAKELGLVTTVVETESLEERLERVAARLAEGPTEAYAEIKTLLRESDRRSLADHLDEERARITSLAETDDYARGLEAFVEKRSPTFEGE